MGIQYLINKFNLTEQDLTKLKETTFAFATEPDTSTGHYAYINPQLIIGTVNIAFQNNNFYDFYDTYHKPKLLDDEVFNSAISNPNTGEYPSIYEIEGKYYLDQGRHRIILSQLKKLESIKVLLKE